MNPHHQQLTSRVRFDWGPAGAAAAVVPGTAVAVVVDVLSFTTTVTVGVARGIEVLPYLWKDDRAESYAAEWGADLATDRVRGLSPAAMSGLDTERIVVPSPNGSVISFALASSGAQVVAGCLRNRTAVARHLANATGPVAVIAAGERWPDGSLRPCAEDLWGAGALLALLDPADLSPEARVAADAFRAVEPRLAESLPACAGGLELAAAGFGADVTIAGELDASDVLPVLEGEAFRAPPR